MPAVAFPNLQPSGRSYSPGKYPQQEFIAQNGAVTRILYGNRRTNAELSLDFNNITDDQAALILQNYEQVAAANNWVTFTNSTAAIGASASLANYIREDGTSGLRWRYSDAPEVTAVVPGRSNVRVRFVGELDGV